MLTIEQVRLYLRDCSPSKVSERSGVEPLTITRIRDGVTPNPKYETLNALSDYIESTFPEANGG